MSRRVLKHIHDSNEHDALLAIAAASTQCHVIHKMTNHACLCLECKGKDPLQHKLQKEEGMAHLHYRKV